MRLADDPVATVKRGALSIDSANQLGLELYRGAPAVGEKVWKWAIDPASSAAFASGSSPP
jgi:hypothetical protein